MRHVFILCYGKLLKCSRALLMHSDFTMKLLYVSGFNKLRYFNGQAKGYVEFINAKKRVPAYADFLNLQRFSHPSFNGLVPNLSEIPLMDKANYIKKYTLEERCINGKIPNNNVIIDESSGSSGMATNWARGKYERQVNAKMIAFGMRSLFGDSPVFIINAFALGAWATGVNVTMSCVKFAKIKSTGPDKLKIANTINDFGKKHKYIIMGYPPFLKSLVDEMKIDWRELDVSFILGGESMAEEMRDYLMKKGIKKIYSSLGASDLELNLAAENDFTISLRRLLRSNELLRKSILKYDGAMPMVFQYNPADFLIDVRENGELVFTICRSGYISPKINYNIYDKGHVLQYQELLAICNELSIDEGQLMKSKTDLPILFHYGRVDMTVSFYGANISPVDIQEVIYSLPQLVDNIHSFHIQTIEDEQGNKGLVIALETNERKGTLGTNVQELQQAFFNNLANINQDFREARKMLSSVNQTQIVFYAFGKGPFRDADIRIKAKYVG